MRQWPTPSPVMENSIWMPRSQSWEEMIHAGPKIRFMEMIDISVVSLFFCFSLLESHHQDQRTATHTQMCISWTTENLGKDHVGATYGCALRGAGKWPPACDTAAGWGSGSARTRKALLAPRRTQLCARACSVSRVCSTFTVSLTPERQVLCWQQPVNQRKVPLPWSPEFCRLDSILRDWGSYSPLHECPHSQMLSLHPVPPATITLFFTKWQWSRQSRGGAARQSHELVKGLRQGETDWWEGLEGHLEGHRGWHSGGEGGVKCQQVQATFTYFFLIVSVWLLETLKLQVYGLHYISIGWHCCRT